MAEIATIARPYAEALMKASGSNAAALVAEIRALAEVAANPQMRQFADDPKAESSQVLDVLASVAKTPSGAAVSEHSKNLVRMVIENGRLAALPAIAAQFQALVDAGTGTSQTTIESAFPITDAQLADICSTMEKRFGKKLEASVVVVPELIGGVRVIVGDEVLDTSIRARLDQMKAALLAA